MIYCKLPGDFDLSFHNIKRWGLNVEPSPGKACVLEQSDIWSLRKSPHKGSLLFYLIMNIMDKVPNISLFS